MRILIFPGMGATKAMYSGLLALNSSIVGCDWPNACGNDDFIDLAKRCIDRYGICGNDVIAGCSMGGMVASEIYKIANCKKLILIGSCMGPKSVPLHGLSLLGSKLFSERLFNLSSDLFPFGIARRSSLLTNPGFVKWSLNAFHRWNGCDGIDITNVKIIHGRFDPIIPIWTIKADVILNGGHLIALTHTKDVNHFINQSVAQQSDAPEPASPAR